MKIKTAGIVIVSVFGLFCGWLVVDALVHHPQQTKQLIGRVVPLAGELNSEETIPTEVEEPAADVITTTPIVYPQLSAASAKEQTVTLGALYGDIERFDDDSKYKFQVELTTTGAAVRTLTLSEFKDRDEENPAHLALLSPLSSGKEVYSLASTTLKVAPADAQQFDSRAFPLDKLNWKPIETDSSDEVRFEALLSDTAITDEGKQAVLRITKTYRVQPGSYDLTCDIAVENLSGRPIQVLMQTQGPGGLSQEDARQDTRKIMTAYLKGSGIETRLLNSTEIRQLEQEKIRPAVGFFASLRNLFGKRENPDIKLTQSLRQNDAKIAWAASTNKYFAAIVRPVQDETTASDGVFFSRAVFYDAHLLEKSPAQQAGASFLLETSRTQPMRLAPANEEGSRRSLSLNVYLGPKDKRIFEKNQTYRALQYFQTIDFRGCCCPQSIIAPMAFGIIWLMNTTYRLMGPLGNYGVIIMFLVFLVRLALHPITKKSQVSMMKMQKLGPKMQEIQKKYANNKAEMNKQVMAMYREMGVSPVSGMLPMFLQMPIWIALWTAVNTSIDLRGAGFLPFWITDLASPDHLFRLPFGLNLPIVGDYFNLLPILMGVVMYAQQKLMPSSQASASTNPQMAQQQKMMMIMMPLLFPVMLYSGPSGVNLYIMSSIGAGVVEQMVIRKHLKEKQEDADRGKVPVTAKTGGKFKKKKPKPMFKG